MRHPFGRGRRQSSAPQPGIPAIDAANWFARIQASGALGVESIEALASDDIPAHFAVLGRAQRPEGRSLLIGFSPQHGGDAALAAIAHARRLAAENAFDGEIVALAPQWSIAARRRLAWLGQGEQPFRALSISTLGESAAQVLPEPPDPLVGLPIQRLADRIADPELRELYQRASRGLEGLAAKHGGSVRAAPGGLELVILARRVALLRSEDARVLLETLQPERSTQELRSADLGAALDRFEGQLRKRLNDRRVLEGEEGRRNGAARALIEKLGLRYPQLWPLGGSDTEWIDLVGLDAEGRPVLVAVRETLDLPALAGILDAALVVRPSLALLFADARAPLRLDAPRLLFVVGATRPSAQHLLGALVFDHALYALQDVAGGASGLELQQEGRGAQPLPTAGEGRSRRRRRRGRGGDTGARFDGAPGGEDARDTGADEIEIASADDESAEEPPGSPALSDAEGEGFEEISLFDLDEEPRPRNGETGRGGRRRRRGRRSANARPQEGRAAAQEPARDGDTDADAESSSRWSDDEADAEADGDTDVDFVSAGAGAEDEPEDDWIAEREQRRRALPEPSELEVESESHEPAKAPRRRAAIVAHADRDSVAAAILLARDLRQVEGFWVYPQEDLMTFFRSVATDLRQETPIYVVGFTARPAFETLQAAALYSGRLGWIDHQDWPPEDLQGLERAIGADNVDVQMGCGSSIPAVLADCSRRSRFSDKLVELCMARFTEHDYERWGRVWWQRLAQIAANPGDRRAEVAALIDGRPSDLARDAALVSSPPPPPEVDYVAGSDFRLVHFGGQALVVVPVPEGLDLHLCGRIARERYQAPLSLAWSSQSELAVLGGTGGRGRGEMDLTRMVEYLAEKHPWVEALRAEDRVARFRLRGAAQHAERLDEVLASIAMGRSILDG